MHDTTFLSVANFVFYALSNIYGFVYVNACNMNCSRKSLLYSSYPSYRDFIIMMVLIVPCYFAGAIIFLRAPTDSMPN